MKKTDKVHGKYATEKEDDLDNARAMMGRDTSPSLEIEAPKKVAARRGDQLLEEDRPAFVKMYTSFKRELKEISGGELKVWIYLALSVNFYTKDARPGLRKIAEDTDLAVNTVRSILEHLEAKNLLDIERADGKRNAYHPCDYTSISKETVSNRDTVTVSNFDTVPAPTVSKSDGTVSKSDGTVSTPLLQNAQLEELEEQEKDSHKLLTEMRKRNPARGIEAKVLIGEPVTGEDLSFEQQTVRERAAINAFERAFLISRPWDWYPDKPGQSQVWEELRAFVVELYEADPDCFDGYFTWSQQDYVKGSMTALGIKRNPQDFRESWSAYQAFRLKNKKSDSSAPPQQIVTPLMQTLKDWVPYDRPLLGKK